MAIFPRERVSAETAEPDFADAPGMTYLSPELDGIVAAAPAPASAGCGPFDVHVGEATGVRSVASDAPSKTFRGSLRLIDDAKPKSERKQMVGRHRRLQSFQLQLAFESPETTMLRVWEDNPESIERVMSATLHHVLNALGWEYGEAWSALEAPPSFSKIANTAWTTPPKAVGRISSLLQRWKSSPSIPLSGSTSPFHFKASSKPPQSQQQHQRQKSRDQPSTPVSRSNKSFEPQPDSPVSWQAPTPPNAKGSHVGTSSSVNAPRLVMTSSAISLPEGMKGTPTESALNVFSKLTAGLIMASGVGQPGRVFGSKVPEFIHDLSAEPFCRFVRADGARRAGLKSTWAVPVIYREPLYQQQEHAANGESSEQRQNSQSSVAHMRCVGVLVFFSRTQIDSPHHLDALRTAFVAVDDKLMAVDASSHALSTHWQSPTNGMRSSSDSLSGGGGAWSSLGTFTSRYPKDTSLGGATGKIQADAVEKLLKCPICRSPLRDAHAVLPCISHTFCGDCIAAWRVVFKVCPTCKGPIEDVKPNNHIQDIVNALIPPQARREGEPVTIGYQPTGNDEGHTSLRDVVYTSD